MKHKFKPSIGGNRGKKGGAAGGGRKEEQTLLSPSEKPPAAPTVEHDQTGGRSQPEEQAACTLRQSGSTTTDHSTGGVCTTQSGVVAEGVAGHIEQGKVGNRGGYDRESEDSRRVVERIEESELEKSQPTISRGKPTPAGSVRVKKKVAPTVVSNRPRRSKPAHANHDKLDIEQDEPVSTTSTSHMNSSVTPRSEAPHSGSPRTVVEETRREVISDTLGDALDAQVSCEELRSSTGDGNLSGVVRSSLDLVCPPPTTDEGATFEMSREERRPSQVCASSGEEEAQDGRPLQRGSERGGVGEVERDAEQDATVGSEETGPDRNEEESRGKSRIRSRKRQSKAVTPATKRRKTGAGISRSPNKLRKAPDRASMTMQELIYYNPSANPMSSSVEEKKRKSQSNETDTEPDTSQPPSRGVTPATLGSDVSSEVSSDTWGESHDSGRLVPQLRMGKDGNIVLDEDSMVVAATARPLTFDDPLNPPLIEGYGHTTSASYRKSSRVTRWTREETSLFFRALSQVGTDFTMMTLLLPKRSRKELKNKFKKEEKNNPHRISQALKSQTSVRPTAAETNT